MREVLCTKGNSEMPSGFGARLMDWTAKSDAKNIQRHRTISSGTVHSLCLLD